MAEHELFLQVDRCEARIAIKQNQQSIQHSKKNSTSKHADMQILPDIRLVWKTIEGQPTNRTFNLYYMN